MPGVTEQAVISILYILQSRQCNVYCMPSQAPYGRVALAGSGLGRSGLVEQHPKASTEAVGTVVRTPGIPYKGTTIHTLVTSNGSPYLNFQNRIM